MMNTSRLFLALMLSCMLPAALAAQGAEYAIQTNTNSWATAGNVDFGFTDNVTVMAWVKWNVTPGNGNNWANIVTLNANTGSGDIGQFWLQHTQYNTSFEFAVQTANGRQVVQSTTAPLGNVWYHVAGVYTGSQLRIYVNGSLENSVNHSGSVRALATTDELFVGRWANAANGYRIFQGDIDEASVWTAALSQTDIRNRMCVSLSSTESGLGAYWRFDAGSGTVIQDHSPNNRNLVFGGSAPQWVCSGAPIGDASAYTYTSNWSGTSITLAHPSGDYVEVANVSGGPTGIHIIRVDHAPNVTTPPGSWDRLSSKRYFIVFVVGGGTVSYRTRYYYLNSNDQGHPGIGGENQLRLAYRDDGCASSWSQNGGNPNTASNYLQISTPHSLPQMQFILATLNANNTLTDDYYRWIGGNGSWTSSWNWQPSRTTVRSTDILVFDNYNNSTVTVSNVPTQTVSNILVSNGAVVQWTSTSNATLTLDNTTFSGPALSIDAGCELTLNGANEVNLVIATAATAEIGGTLRFGSSAGHSMVAAAAGAVTFLPGSQCIQENAGPVFGNSGTANVVSFRSGSRFVMQATNPAAVAPFGLSAPSSKVAFSSGSTYELRSTVAGAFPLSGRSYPNVAVTTNTAYVVGTAFGGAASIDTLEIASGSSLSVSHSSGTGNGTIGITGDIIANGDLQFGSQSAVQYTLVLNGTEPQAIRGSGAITLPANLAAVNVLSGTHVRLERDLSVACALRVSSGEFRIGANTLTLAGALDVQPSAALIGGSNSRLVFAGSGASTTLPAIDLLDLTINRPAGISTSGTVRVEGTLALQSGQLGFAAQHLILNGIVSTSGGTWSGGPTSELTLGGTQATPLPAVELGTLRVNKSGGATLAGGLRVHSLLELTQGVISLGNYDALLSYAASVGGTPSNSAMLALTGSGKVVREVTAPGSFDFPLGERNGSDDYTPVRIDLTSATITTPASITVGVSNSRHPQDNGSGAYLNRYWTVTSSGIAAFSANVAAQYVQADVSGNEQRLMAGRYTGSDWEMGQATDTSTNTLSFIAITAFGDFTGREIFSRILISLQNGNWDASDTWDGSRIPSSTDSVIVRHSVALGGNAQCQGLWIDASGILAHAAMPAQLVVAGGWTNDGSYDPGTFITTVLTGRADTVFGVAGTVASDFHDLSIDKDYAVLADVRSSGTVEVGLGATLFAQSSTITLSKSGVAWNILGAFDAGNSTVVYSADAPQAIAAVTYYNLTLLATSGTQDRIPDGDLTVANTLTIGSGARLTAGGYRIDLKGLDPLQISGGMFSAETSTIAYSSTTPQSVAAATYHHLLLGKDAAVASPPLQKSTSGSIVATGSVTVEEDIAFTMGSSQLDIAGDLVQRGNEIGSEPLRAGHVQWSAGGELRFSGSGNSLLYGNHTVNAADAVILTIAKNSSIDTVRLTATGSVTPRLLLGANAVLDVQSGVLDYGDAMVTATQPVSSAFSIATGSTVRSSGASNFPLSGGGTHTFASTTFAYGSTVELYGASQSVAGSDRGVTSYGVLRLLGEGGKTLTGGVSILDSLRIDSPVTFDDNGNTLVYGLGTVLRYRMAGDSIPSRQTLQTSGDEFPAVNGPATVVIDNPKHVRLHDNRSLSMGVEFLRGKMLLGSASLTLGPAAWILGANEQRFFLTDGVGALKRSNVGASGAEYPIGTLRGATLSDTSYAPVIVANSGTADNISMRVQASVDNPPFFMGDAVNLQWTAAEDVPGGTALTLTVQWSSADAGSTFNPGGSVALNYHSSTWTEAAAMVSGAGPWTATASGIPEVSKYYVGMSNPLPVELRAFTAHRSADVVQLRWETASELMNNGFDVERSLSGESWEAIGWVPGAGTSHTPRSYAWLDTLTANAREALRIQYRLAQVDADGSVRYSPVVEVWREERPLPRGTVNVYPQPLRDKATITFMLAEADVLHIQLFTAAGTMLRTIQEAGYYAAGTHSVGVDVSTLPAGSYFVVLRGAKGSASRMLVKL